MQTAKAKSNTVLDLDAGGAICENAASVVKVTVCCCWPLVGPTGLPGARDHVGCSAYTHIHTHRYVCTDICVDVCVYIYYIHTHMLALLDRPVFRKLGRN